MNITRPSLFRRSAAWFILAATGNLSLGVLTFVAWASPLGLDPSDSLNFLGEYARPLYAPTLLIFTALLGIVMAVYSRSSPTVDSEGEGEDAGRLIARAVQFALIFVLSFAGVIVATTPQSIGIILFACLLGFVTFVMAERLTPPRALTLKENERKLAAELTQSQARVDIALGPGWSQRIARRPRITVACALVVPVLVQVLATLIAAAVIWGTAFAFSPEGLFMFLISGIGQPLLTFAWYSMSDKAESPQARGWRGGALICFAVASSASVSSVFILAGPSVGIIGGLIVAVTALNALALWGPFAWPVRTLLRRVQASVSDRHITHAKVRHERARALWLAEHRDSLRRAPVWRRWWWSINNRGFGRA